MVILFVFQLWKRYLERFLHNLFFIVLTYNKMRRSGLTRTSVYSQKLPNSYKSTDISDDSAIVTLPPSFDIMKKGKPFIIERPAFKKGTASAIIDEGKRTANLQNNRSGLGNNLIIRQSFETPNVAPRQATAYALEELLAQQQQGIKVQLADKTLSDLFKLVTVDPEDKVWLSIYATEFKRLTDEGKSEDEAKEILKASPPLGRPQRPMTKMVNFGSVVDLSQKSSLSLNEKLDALTVAISSLSALELPITLAKIMEMITGITSFTPAECAKISALLDATKAVPTDYAGYGLTHAIFSYDQYMSSDNALINTYLGANIPLGLKPHLPVFSSGGSPIEWKQIPKTLKLLHNAVDQDGNPIPSSYQYYLNLPERRIMTRAETLDLVNISGIDSGRLNGENPPAPDPSVGGSPHWLSESEEEIATKKKSLKSPELELPEPEPVSPIIPPLSLDVDEPFISPPPRPPKEKEPAPPATPTRPWEAGARIPVATSTTRKANNFQYYLDVNKAQYTMENPSLTPAVVKCNLTEIWNRFTKEEKARWTDANNGVGSSSSKA